MAFLTTPDADAGWRRRYYGYYPAPRVVYAPPVVYAPAPAIVAPVPPVVPVYPPRVYAAPPYYYGRPAVVVPPRIITPWFQMY